MSATDFYTDWEVDFPNRIIRRKPRSTWLRVKQFCKRPKYYLSSFHQFAREVEASSNGIVFDHILDSDAMKAVRGVPKKLEIVNGWKIPPEDISVLIGDGYVLLGYGELLVREATKFPISDAIEIKPRFLGISIDLKKIFRKLFT